MESCSGVIKREMSLFEASNVRHVKLDLLYHSLKTIQPASVKSERAFSSLGRFVTPLRKSLMDESLDALVFMRQHFQNQRRRN